MRWRWLAAALAVAAVAAAPAGGADLVEPWDPGFTDLEVWVSGGEGGGTELAMVAGFGLGGGVSVGATLAGDGTGDWELGGIAMLTSGVTPGSELDLWLEVGVAAASPEAEVGRVTWAAGGELSVELAGWTPYLRLYRSVDGGRASLHPLAGAMVPLAGGRLELHLELSSEEPEGGPWPLHLAVGPNLHLSEAVELLPEVSVVREGATGESGWAVTVGVVVDPSRLLGHAGGTSASS